MTTPIHDKLFEQLVQRIDPRSELLRAWPLAGGVSAQVTALEIEPPDGLTRKLVVRQYGAVDLASNPQIAQDEYRLLEQLQAVGVAAPAPLYFDQTAAIFPTPYLVTDYIEGETEVDPSHLSDAIPQLAGYLARLHTLDVSRLDLDFLPRQAQRVTRLLSNRPVQPDETWGEGRIRDALEAAWPLAPPNPSVLLHGDFWPGNALWRDSCLVAVIDWEDAAQGDPLADLANARLEILWAFGLEAMRQFTEHYQALTTFDMGHLSYWDLYAALRPIAKIGTWGLDALTMKSMRDKHRRFVAQAMERLRKV